MGVLTISLCNHKCKWYLPSLDDLNQLIKQSSQDVGPRSIFISAPSLILDSVWDELEQFIRRYIRNGVLHEIEELDSELMNQPIEALKYCLEISDSGDQALIDYLTKDDSIRKEFHCVRLSNDSIANRDQLDQVFSLARKLGSEKSLAMICFVEDPDQVHHVDVRIDQGKPLPFGESVGDHDQWSAYVHSSLSWFVGGSLYDLEGLIPSSVSLPLGDERRLQTALDEASDRLFTKLSPEIQERLLESVTKASIRTSLPQLFRSRLISGEGWPTPWLARSLLKRRVDHQSSLLLKSLIPSHAVSTQILQRCVSLEVAILNLVLSTADSTDLSCLDLAEIERKTIYYCHQLAVPKYQIENFTLGQCIDELYSRISHKKNIVRNLYIFKNIRNMAAHGEAIGWKAHVDLQSLEKSLIYELRAALNNQTP